MTGLSEASRFCRPEAAIPLDFESGHTVASLEIRDISGFLCSRLGLSPYLLYSTLIMPARAYLAKSESSAHPNRKDGYSERLHSLCHFEPDGDIFPLGRYAYQLTFNRYIMMEIQTLTEEKQQAEVGKMNADISKTEAETDKVKAETKKLDGEMDVRLAEMRKMNADAAVAQAEMSKVIAETTLILKKSTWYPLVVGSGATIALLGAGAGAAKLWM